MTDEQMSMPLATSLRKLLPNMILTPMFWICVR